MIDRAFVFRVVVLAVLIASASSGQVDETAPAEAAKPATLEQIGKWIKDLDSDRFIEREEATLKLMDAGQIAVKPLSTALPDSSLESVTRGIYVLRELALAPDVQTADASRGVLEKFAALEGTSLARLSTRTLDALDEIRQQRAISFLEAKGARIGTTYVQVGLAMMQNVFSVEIDDQWEGETKDLQRLAWLGDAQQVVLTGSKISDEVVGHVVSMSNLSIVTIKRAKMSDRGMADLKKLKNVQQLSVMYTPIGDASVEHLQAHRNASLLKLYGTEMTKQAADKLQAAMPACKIDYRHGAFLGIGCNPHPDGCAVAIIHPDSSAAKAGIRIDDVIVTYEGEKTVDFENLTKLIARNKAGDTVSMVIHRGEQELTKKITLGEWE